MVDSILDETGNNPGTLRLNRTYTVGDMPVSLGFSGTASFGADYQVDLPDFSGVATIPSGSTFLDLPILPVPDSRAEGNETVIVTVLASPQGDYAVGTPSSQTLSILDDDSNQIPLNGWSLTDLGMFGGAGAYGSGINTLPDGNGGWRGQAVGYVDNMTNPTYAGWKWNNGTSSFLYWPIMYTGESSWSVALSLNDACSVVGYAGWWTSSSGYYQRPCFWRVNDSYATALSVLSPSASNPLYNAATDINQRNDLQGTGGVIAGNNATANGKVHAVAWIPDGNGNYGAVTDLGDIGDGSQFSYAGAINNQGVLIGKGQISGANNYHAFRSRSANLVPLNLSSQSDDMGTATFVDAHSTEGNDINDLGEMIGASDCPCGQYHAVYKSPLSAKNVGYYDLGVLGQGTSDAGDQSIALAISAKGLIVGQSKLKVGGSMVWRAFVVSNQGNPGSQPMLNLGEQSWVWTGTQWQRADLNGWILTSASSSETCRRGCLFFT